MNWSKKLLIYSKSNPSLYFEYLDKLIWCETYVTHEKVYVITENVGINKCIYNNVLQLKPDNEASS